MSSPTMHSRQIQSRNSRNIVKCSPKPMNTSLKTALADEPLNGTQVHGRCECDTQITVDEKEEGTWVPVMKRMRCKARGCQKGWVTVYQGVYQIFLRKCYNFLTHCMRGLTNCAS